MWSLKSLAFPPEIVLEDMEVTWIVLGINLFKHMFHPPLGKKKLEGMESGLIKVFEVEEYYNLVQLEERELKNLVIQDQ